MNDGRLEGHSTDVVAFRQVFGRAPEGAPLLVLGAGGSARAAVAAWSRDGVHVSARAPGRATVVGAAVPWGEGLPGAVVVNATPLGMAGEELPESVLAEASFLVDLPYGSAPTPAVVAARAAGLGHVDGIEFLAIQGAASFRWWTGVAVDLDRLIEVARNA
jgi:shikimate 5-dehydrogenase